MSFAAPSTAANTPILYVDRIGVATAGMANWSEGRTVLRSEKPFIAEPMAKYTPQLLPANEKRRATELVRLAFNVCEQLVTTADDTAINARSVFASGGGDYHIIHQICEVLTTSERFVSPTQFHNSVHNSAAGYWSIATGSTKPSLSLSGGDHSFVAGLLEAGTTLWCDSEPVLLAVYDIVPPPPLWAKRPITQPFGCALLLTPQRQATSLARLQVDRSEQASQVTAMDDSGLETLRLGNPAARSLPLLAAIAHQQKAKVVFDTAPGTTIEVMVEPY